MKSFLVVDDGAFMRVLIKRMLTSMGYAVIGEAEDGEAAVNKYIELKPDIVTLDITMPNKDGIAALKEILRYDDKAKVIMVSSMGQEEYIRAAIGSGAKGFIVKPFDESSLHAAINGL